MSAATQPKSSPFDALAPVYDVLFTDSQIGRAQRRTVWSSLQRVFKPGERILEINCGTGVDAVFLARMGVRVLALDSSAGMVAATQRRIERESAEKLVSTRQMAIEELGDLQSPFPFDGVLSNFGGLNCVSDLQQLGRNLARLLRPGGRAVLCVMGRWCIWEVLYYLGRLDFERALRRTKRGGALVEFQNSLPSNLRTERPSAGLTYESSQLRIHYPTASRLSRSLAPHFIRRFCVAVGLVVPPSYLEPWISRHPEFLKIALRIDACMGHWPGLRNLGDHYLVEMERT